MAAALRARRRRPDLDITVVERTDRIAVANCAIPAFLRGEIESADALQQLSITQAVQQHRLNVLLRHQAVEINPVRRRVTVENRDTGQTFSTEYDTLVIATGAEPVRPDWYNKNAGAVFTLRNAYDAQSLRDFLERKRPAKIAVIGAGTIAQGTASALTATGAKVTLICLPGLLVEDLEPTLNKAIEDVLRANGIDLYFSDNLHGFEVSLDGNVTGIASGNGVIPCDCVLLAMGIRPGVDVARSAGLSLGAGNAVRVDRRLTTSNPRIFACGDCAETYNRITGKPVYWPLATTAARQGRQAGESASGGSGYDPGTLMTRLWTCFDMQIGRVGLSYRQAQNEGFKPLVTEVRSLTKPKLSRGDELLLLLISDEEDGRVLGAQLMGREGVTTRLHTLCAAVAGRLTLRDLENLDLGYTPELTALWDPVLIAGRLGMKEK